MAISSSGIGSGLDINSLVTQLVAAERAPAQNQLSTRKTRLSTQLSAIGTFRAAMATLQDKLAGLKSGGAIGKLAATSASTDHFTATAAGSAVAGRYDIEVVALAQAHKLTSAPYVGGASTALGAGDVTIDVGGDDFTVTLSPSANTLADLRDAINNASDNSGVTATLINETNGTRLLLTSKTPGEDHEITVTSTLATFTEQQAAQDAHIRVDGYDVYASSNQISDAIDGVTINLAKANPGSSYALDVALDNKATSDAVQVFVNTYNAALNTINTLSKYDPKTEVAAALNGDGMVRGAAQQLRQVVSASVSGAGSFSHLSELGITTQADGTLKLDSSKLASALASDRDSVQKLFGAEDGVATRLDAVLERLVGDDGQVETRNDSLQRQLDDVADRQDALDFRMTRVEARYRAQYTALDSLLAQMQTTSNYLSQQLASLANFNTNNRN